MKGAFPYMGGKSIQSKMICSIIDSVKHEIYVEPFCGAASVFFTKKPSKIEVINDLDSNIFNFFNVLRDYYDELIKVLELIPYSREMYSYINKLIKTGSFKKLDSVKRAAYWYFRICSTYNSWSAEKLADSSFSISKMSNKANTFMNRVNGLSVYVRRIKNAIIENLDAFDVIKKYDTPKTLFYIDPPYYKCNKRYYNKSFDMHEELRDLLSSIKGHFLVSYFKDDYIYNLYKDYNIMEYKLRMSSSDVKRVNVELLITNFSIESMLHSEVNNKNKISVNTRLTRDSSLSEWR